MMTAKIFQDAMRRVEAWPESAQVELAELALEIDEGFPAEAYHATPKERAGIERGLKDAREVRFATDEQVTAAFDGFRRA
jgi:predicted transcriptional regulator